VIPRNLTILIAEDNEDSRGFLRVFLEDNGFNVVEAKNGVEAVSLARRERPELILTDLHMPELDGIAAIKKIREIPELSDVPILAVSGDGQRGIELFACMDEFGTGYIDYLTKPLSFSGLMEKINGVLSVQA
jgi:CheY-like chemotaxis protein